MQPHLFKFGCTFSTDAPDIAQIREFECLSSLFLCVDQAATPITLVLFGKSAGEFGQRLGGSQSYTHGNACPLLNNLRESAAKCLVVFDFRKDDEAFVDAILLHFGYMSANDRHYAARHVTI